MATYFSVTNETTEVIDDSFFNLAFIRKQRFYFPEVGKNETLYYTTFYVDVSDVSEPLVAFSSICATCVYSYSPTTIVIKVGGANQHNVPNAVSKMNNTSNFVDVFIFGKPKDNTPNIGLKVWDAKGGLVFDANYKYLKPVSVLDTGKNYSPVAGGTRPFNGNQVVTLDSGKSYAVFPLCRVFAVYAEYLSDGYEFYWQADIYSSACAIDGTTMYLTSNKVDQVEDTSVNNIGVCRHQYVVIDVTNY